jgi:Arm DNA-binding domain
MLTEADARELMPPDELPIVSYRLVFDGGNGLALQILPSGDKRWIWQGRDGPKGRMVRLSLAQWGQCGLSVRQARRLAVEVRRRVRAGENVEALRRELKERWVKVRTAGDVDTSRTPPR